MEFIISATFYLSINQNRGVFLMKNKKEMDQKHIRLI